MWRARLTLVLLLVICFTLAITLQQRSSNLSSTSGPSESPLASLLGDGRQMVADYFYVQADVYFHSGYYPSVFDQARAQEEKDSDVSQPDEGADHEEKNFMGEPLDWIERFSRHFQPSRHTHLAGETVEEMLPWMKLSAELDPNRVQTYIVTAYWLRERLHKSAEAEDFIRAGLKANPHSAELLFALGELYLEDRKDLPRAKNLLLAAVKYWHESEDSKPEKAENDGESRNYLLLERILGGLIHEELAAGRPGEAIEYMKALKANATDPAGVQKQIDELQAKINDGTIPTNPPPH